MTLLTGCRVCSGGTATSVDDGGVIDRIGLLVKPPTEILRSQRARIHVYKGFKIFCAQGHFVYFFGAALEL